MKISKLSLLSGFFALGLCQASWSSNYDPAEHLDDEVLPNVIGEEDLGEEGAWNGDRLPNNHASEVEAAPY